MTDFRLVRMFGQGTNPTTAKAYRVETAELLTEAEAFKLMEQLGSPYEGRKYEPSEADPQAGHRYTGGHPIDPGFTIRVRSGDRPHGEMVLSPSGEWVKKYPESGVDTAGNP